MEQIRGRCAAPPAAGAARGPTPPQHGHGWATRAKGVPETKTGWKLKEDGNCLLFARKKYQMYPHRVRFFFLFFSFRQLCLGLFVSEAGFLNHPKQTKKGGRRTDQTPKQSTVLLCRFHSTLSPPEPLFPSARIRRHPAQVGHSLATAPSLQHQMGSTLCSQPAHTHCPVRRSLCREVSFP